MASPRTLIRVFVGSPADVQSERRRLVSVIEELNRTLAPDRGFTLELVRWETHALPGMGRPQDVVDRSIGAFDIFVGVMWKKFGTPTGRAESGTQEEFEAAYQQWAATQQPDILFYFNEKPYLLRTPDEADQVRRVLQFRARVEALGLIRSYHGAPEFERLVREHLSRLISRWDPKAPPPKAAPRRQSPVQELFEAALGEWKRFGLHASSDRLALFLAGHEELRLQDARLRFVVLSTLRTRPWEPWESLKGLGDDEAVSHIGREFLENAVADPTTLAEETASGAIRLLGATKDARSAATLVRVIRSGLPTGIRAQAVQALDFSPLNELGLREVAETLVDVLRSDSDTRMRRSAAYPLGHVGYDATEALLEALSDSRAEVRGAAAEALARRRDEAAVPDLVELSKREGSRLVLKKIIWALYVFRQDPNAHKALESLAAAADAVVADQAQSFLR